MKKMRFSLRMKRAGKNVISILTIRKSWISHKIIPFIEPTSDVLTRQLGKPNSKEKKSIKGKVGCTQCLSSGRAWENEKAAKQTIKK